MNKQWEEDRKAMNKLWIEIVNNMGTLAEDNEIYDYFPESIKTRR